MPLHDTITTPPQHHKQNPSYHFLYAKPIPNHWTYISHLPLLPPCPQIKSLNRKDVRERDIPLLYPTLGINRPDDVIITLQQDWAPAIAVGWFLVYTLDHQRGHPGTLSPYLFRPYTQNEITGAEGGEWDLLGAACIYC